MHIKKKKQDVVQTGAEESLYGEASLLLKETIMGKVYVYIAYI